MADTQTFRNALTILLNEKWDTKALDHAKVRNARRLVCFAALVLDDAPESVITGQLRLIVRKLREQGHGLNGFDYPREDA